MKLELWNSSLIGVLLIPAWALASDQVYLRQEGDGLRFGNASVELTLDAKSGYFRNILNKRTGVQHKKPDDGVWPFGLCVGTRDDPEQMKAEIRADGAQEMTCNLTERGNGVKRLRLVYPMLVDNRSAKPTGVGLGVEIELAPKRNYLLIQAEIANGGPLWVTRFYAGHGEVRTGEPSRSNETIWFPGRGGFQRDGFTDRSYGLPTYGSAWVDFSGQASGIGMAYINKQGIQQVFDLKATSSGMLLGWRTFDIRDYWHFESSMNTYQKSLRIVPLEPANTFTTDEWLIVPHSGDWHQTADAYRERYVEVFKNDYMDWARLPQKVKDLHLRLGFWVAENWIGNAYPRKLFNHLDSIVPQVETVLRETGAKPEQVSVMLTWFGPHVGRYPQFFPVYEAAGGESSWRRMIDRLHEMGIAYVTGYTHLSYTHPAATNYVVQADVLDTVPPINPNGGNRACVDNSAWIRLWRDELIPAYKAHGLDGVYADEGHFPWGTCHVASPIHLHGTSAVGILTANTRGITRLHKLIREGMGPGSVIMVEGAGCVAGRWVDASHAYPDPAVAYTLPFKRYFWYGDAQTPDPALPEKVNIALAHGYVFMFNLQQEKLDSGRLDGVSGDPLAATQGSIKDFAPLRRYVLRRREIEAADPPGYPQGFRDTVGVQISEPALIAKTFSDRDGITVVYYATAPVSAEITVDASALGHPALGSEKRRLELEKDELGFLVLHNREASG